MSLPLLLILVIPVILADTNLFLNPGLESTSGWECVSCTGSLSSDSRTGSYSFKVEARQQNWAGASQTVKVNGGHYYYFKIWVKILNTASGKWYHDIQAVIDVVNKWGGHQYYQLGDTNYATPGIWYAVGGDYFIPPEATSVRFYVQIPEVGVNYLVDDAEMTLVPDYLGSDSDVNARIDQLRKADLQISLSGGNPSGIQMKLEQTKSEFGWGSAVDARMIVDNNHKAYQSFFYDLFEWSVLENALKWPGIENNHGQPNYDTALQAVNALESRGILMRGHNIFWGGQFVPYWQNNMNGDQLKPELEKHIQGMTSHFKGRFKHWDVNNENLHLHFYEDKLHDNNITQWMFREVHRLDPTSVNFLNDYNVVSHRYATVALIGQASSFKDTGVPVGGLGLQGHFDPGMKIDLSIVKKRLDEVAKVGLPIWITELDISDPNENTKAQKYEDLMKLFFSHPAVKGVMFWGFWDGRHWRPQAAIANGNNVTPNAAGRKVQELLKQTWRTNETHDIAAGQTLKIRAFKGSYKLSVLQNGKVIHTENFTVDRNGNHLQISLGGSGSNTYVDHVLIG